MFAQIVSDVRSWLTTRGITAIVDDGPESRDEQLNYGTDGRVVFVPSTSPMAIIPPLHIGEGDDGRRQLLNVMLAYDVFIAAHDKAAGSSTLAHQAKAIALFEAVAQAAQRSYWGLHKWGTATWQVPRKNMSRGAELAVGLTLNVPLFDTESVLVTPEGVPGAPKPVT